MEDRHDFWQGWGQCRVSCLSSQFYLPGALFYWCHLVVPGFSRDEDIRNGIQGLDKPGFSCRSFMGYMGGRRGMIVANAQAADPETIALGEYLPRRLIAPVAIRPGRIAPLLPAAYRSIRLSGLFIQLISRQIRPRALVNTVMPILAVPFAKASPRTADASIRQCLMPRSRRRRIVICKRYTLIS